MLLTKFEKFNQLIRLNDSARAANKALNYFLKDLPKLSTLLSVVLLIMIIRKFEQFCQLNWMIFFLIDAYNSKNPNSKDNISNINYENRFYIVLIFGWSPQNKMCCGLKNFCLNFKMKSLHIFVPYKSTFAATIKNNGSYFLLKYFSKKQISTVVNRFT